ncbi:MAG TPA: hypothetical protein VHE35_08850, partial [Kofleriaceae bacterium]|nr:hypothetical protein [Kofleriaceae bacterium]
MPVNALRFSLGRQSPAPGQKWPDLGRRARAHADLQEACALLVGAPMPSLEHEAPLVVLREEPALVPALLREVVGLELPPFETVEVADSSLNQPIELRADLVVALRGPAPDRRMV